MGYLIFAIFLGVPLGVGLALTISASILNKSNNFGDSKGTLTTFSKKGLQGKYFKDHVSRGTALDPLLHPVIRANDQKAFEAINGQAPTRENPLDAEINNTDLDGISWHR